MNTKMENRGLKMEKNVARLCLAILYLLSSILCPRAAHAGNAVITLLDAQSNPLPGEVAVLSYFSAPQSQYSGVAVAWRNQFTADGTGTIYLTNAAPGKWMVTPVDEAAVAFTFYMPVTNGTIYVSQGWTTASAGNTLPPGTMSYDVNASDLRYLQASAASGIFDTNGAAANASAAASNSVVNGTWPAAAAVVATNTPDGGQVASIGDVLNFIGYSTNTTYWQNGSVNIWSPLQGIFISRLWNTSGNRSADLYNRVLSDTNGNVALDFGQSALETNGVPVASWKAGGFQLLQGSLGGNGGGLTNTPLQLGIVATGSNGAAATMMLGLDASGKPTTNAVPAGGSAGNIGWAQITNSPATNISVGSFSNLVITTGHSANNVAGIQPEFQINDQVTKSNLVVLGIDTVSEGSGGWAGQQTIWGDPLGYANNTMWNIGGLHFASASALNNGMSDPRFFIVRVKDPAPASNGTNGSYTLFENRYDSTYADADTLYANFLNCANTGNVGIGDLGAFSDNKGQFPAAKVQVYGSASGSYPAFAVVQNWANSNNVLFQISAQGVVTANGAAVTNLPNVSFDITNDVNKYLFTNLVAGLIQQTITNTIPPLLTSGAELNEEEVISWPGTAPTAFMVYVTQGTTNMVVMSRTSGMWTKPVNFSTSFWRSNNFLFFGNGVANSMGADGTIAFGQDNGVNSGGISIQYDPTSVAFIVYSNSISTNAVFGMFHKQTINHNP